MKILIFSYTTRILHFLFATFILSSYLLSDIPSLLWLHSTLGIVALFIVLLRVIWFLFGEEGAKISSFDLKYKSLKYYILEYFCFKNSKIRNPAASYSAILMWILTFLVGITGIVFIGAKYGSGLLSFLYFRDIDPHFIKEMHELFGNLLILTAGLHVIGVIADNYLKKSGIVKTMLDGTLKVKAENILPFSNSKLTAIFSTSLILLFILYLVSYRDNIFFNTQVSHNDYKSLAPVMYAECKECHVFYPPNLTSLQTQMNILNNLENHFGTDASLDNKTLALIIQETKLFGKIKSQYKFEDLENNESITKTEQWKHFHEEFDDNWYVEHKIKRTNCKACHIGFEDGSINPFEIK